MSNTSNLQENIKQAFGESFKLEYKINYYAIPMELLKYEHIDQLHHIFVKTYHQQKIKITVYKNDSILKPKLNLINSFDFDITEQEKIANKLIEIKTTIKLKEIFVKK